jgi:hypothetical protein
MVAGFIITYVLFLHQINLTNFSFQDIDSAVALVRFAQVKLFHIAGHFFTKMLVLIILARVNFVFDQSAQLFSFWR